MNKLKPYHEPETTQAYALQILACHLLETELRGKQNHLPTKSGITQSPTTPSKEKITPHTGSTINSDQATLEAEDLEIHRAMLEVYWAQPSTLGGHNPQLMWDEETNSLKGNNAPINHLGNTFGNLELIQLEIPGTNTTYPTSLDFREGRTDHSRK